MGAEHGASKDRRTWKEKRQAEAESLGSTTQPYVLVIGGGQGGIALGSRLRQLGVPTLVVDKHPRPGDQWRNRYKSLCLHDPVWYDHLPYLKFPDNWPVFAPEGQDRRLARVVREGDGGAVLVEHHGDLGHLVGGDGRVDRRGRARGDAADAAAEAARVRDRDVGKARMPEIAGTDVFRGDVHH